MAFRQMHKPFVRGLALTLCASLAYSSTAVGVNAIATSLLKAAQAGPPAFTHSPTRPYLGAKPGRAPHTRGGLWSERMRRFADSSAEHRAEPPLMASASAGYAVATHTLAISADSGSSEPWEGSAPSASGSVNTGNGNKLTSLNLLSWKFRGGMTLDFSLFHNSQTNYNDELGHGWTWSYDVYINNLSGNPVVHFGDGRSIPFTAPGSTGGGGSGPGGGGGGLDPGMTEVPAEYLVASTAMAAALPYYQTTSTTYTAPVGIYDSLVKNADSTWTLTKKTGVKYLFNTAGFLTRIQDRNNNGVNLTLNAGNYVTKITDPTGRYVNVSVDASGNFQSIADHTGRTWTFTRNAADDLVSVTWPTLDGVTHQDQFAYNAGHDITARTDKRGKVWSATYNSDGSLASETNPLNQTTTYTYASGYTDVKNPLNGVVRHNYSSGALASVVDESGFNVSYTSRDANKNVLTKVDKRGKTWTYTYDAKGNVLSVKDPLLKTTSYTYNGFAQALTKTDALNNQSTFTYDANGNLLTVKNPLNKVVLTNAYGTYGLLTSTTNALNQTTSYGYDAHGNVTSVTNPLSQTRTMAYDALGRVTSATSALNQTEQIGYDAWGRAVTAIHADATTSSKSYDPEGNLLSETDERTQTKTYAYNDAGRLTSHTNARGDVESYGYDAAGRRTSVTNGRGKTRTYAYTARGDVHTLSMPDGAVETWSYDGNGNNTAYTNPLSQTVSYVFDDAGRKTKVDYPLGTDTTFAYDAADRLTSMADATGTTTWGYDAASRLTSLTAPQGSQTYTYNDADRRATMVETGVGTTTYGYDAAGRLTSLTNPLGEATTYTYDAAGRLSKKTLATGVYTDYGYDARDRKASVVSKRTDGTTVSSESYTYENDGNLKTKTVGGTTTTYTYDAADQLLSESRTGYSASYTYDGNGNRLSKTVGGTTESYSYDDGDKLLSASGKSYTYDAAGRTKTVVSSAGTTTLNYDYENRVTGIQYPSGATNSFSYNGLDTRVGKTDSAGTHTYRRDGAEVTSPVLGDGKATYTPGVSERRGGVSKFYTQDQLGSTTSVTNASQAVTDTRTYDTFGLTVASTGTTPTPFGFVGEQGYQSDQDSGLQLLGHRYYDPSTGRFLTRDGAKDGRNWYAYCDNNPLVRTDPTGQWWETGLDIAFLIKGVKDFIEDPNLENGLGVAADVVFLVAPVPNVAAIRHLDDVGDVGKIADDIPRVTPEGCFAAGTQVLMADGSTKNIEDVQAGDEVLSRSDKGGSNGKLESRRVARTFVREHLGTLLLRLEDGQTLETTEEHPFFVKGRGFVPAGELKVGQRVAEDRAESTAIEAIVRLAPTKTVYNFEVEGTHTYFVKSGDDALWVHNTCRTGAGSEIPSRGGPPNGTLVGENPDGSGTIRKYDSSGNAEVDYDFGHDHGQGDPHKHPWDWGFPGKKKRRPGEPLDPTDTY